MKFHNQLSSGDTITTALVLLLGFLFASTTLSGASDTEWTLTGTVEAPGGNPISNGLVVIKGVPESVVLDRTPVMDQVNKTFVPQILPVRNGTTVVFKNSDTMSHNVRMVRLPEYKQLENRYVYEGDTIAYTVNKTGTIQVECDVHPTMEAHILVFADSFKVSQISSEGSFHFDLKNAPPADARIKAWSELYGFTPTKSISEINKIPKGGEVIFSYPTKTRE